MTYPPPSTTVEGAVRRAIQEVDDFYAINLHIDEENEMVLRAMDYLKPFLAEEVREWRDKNGNG